MMLLELRAVTRGDELFTPLMSPPIGSEMRDTPDETGLAEPQKQKKSNHSHQSNTSLTGQGGEAAARWRRGGGEAGRVAAKWRRSGGEAGRVAAGWRQGGGGGEVAARRQRGDGEAAAKWWRSGGEMAARWRRGRQDRHWRSQSPTKVQHVHRLIVNSVFIH